jgi:hypothetical protein
MKYTGSGGNRGVGQGSSTVEIGGIKGAESDGDSHVPIGFPTNAVGRTKSGGADGDNHVNGVFPPITTAGMMGVGSNMGSKGVSKTSGVGSSGEVFPCGSSDNILAHRVLAIFVPSVMNLSPLATRNFFFVQKISWPIRYET